MNFVEPIRDPVTVKDMGDYLKERHEKYYIMYMTGIYSGLRISDILRLKVRDVRGKEYIKIREKKTGKEKLFPIAGPLAAALAEYCADKKDYQYLVPSARAMNKAISREYAYRIIREAGERFGLESVGTHTLRKTFGYHFYMQTKDVVLLMKIFNHSSESATLRYIGIEQTTINEAYRRFRYDY